MRAGATEFTDGGGDESAESSLAGCAFAASGAGEVRATGGSGERLQRGGARGGALWRGAWARERVLCGDRDGDRVRNYSGWQGLSRRTWCRGRGRTRHHRLPQRAAVWLRRRGLHRGAGVGEGVRGSGGRGFRRTGGSLGCVVGRDDELARSRRRGNWRWRGAARRAVVWALAGGGSGLVGESVCSRDSNCAREVCGGGGRDRCGGGSHGLSARATGQAVVRAWPRISSRKTHFAPLYCGDAMKVREVVRLLESKAWRQIDSAKGGTTGMMRYAVVFERPSHNWA